MITCFKVMRLLSLLFTVGFLAFTLVRALFDFCGQRMSSMLWLWEVDPRPPFFMIIGTDLCIKSHCAGFLSFVDWRGSSRSFC
ncbi:hypothetical protein V8C37DRAFT_365889, partial [Trichoderma ceciliae]